MGGFEDFLQCLVYLHRNSISTQTRTIAMDLRIEANKTTIVYIAAVVAILRLFVSFVRYVQS
jgi:hypothetical protein